MAKSVPQGEGDAANELPLVSLEEKVGRVKQQWTARDSKAALF
jgi:hypothetical protein